MSDLRDTVNVKGLSELGKLLEEIGPKIAKNVARGAMRAGAKVILTAAKERVPVSLPSAKNQRLYGGYTGALRDSLRISTRSRGGQVSASVKVGGNPKGADVYYAAWVEYGTKPHTIKARSRGTLAFAGGYYRQVEHPGATPKPFLRPALDVGAAAAVVAAGEYMKARLATKHGLDTAEIIIEEENDQ